ncbi:MAG: hypothetical protein Q8L56_03535 [Rhodocyclaceae bacterium]|nr:hypothetical protein [Rhodocyclaceae bacterium]
MGGFGSGRHGGKDTTNAHWRLDVRLLQRDGLLTPGRAWTTTWTRNGEEVAAIQARTEADRVILNYLHRSGDGEWKNEECPVSLDWTDCTYGGRRAWFICPAAGCGRRVAVLHSGAIFACRHCYRLAYACECETADDRTARRANRIRERLGWHVGILNPKGWKPKGMHWRTFKRLEAKHDDFVGVALAGMVKRLRLKIHGRQ